MRDAKLLSRDVLVSSPKRIIHEKLQMPDGVVIDWYFLDMRESVVVVPLTADQRIVMIRQYRYNLGKDVLEFPSGTIDPGEKPEDAAVRELLEETGYEISVSELRVLGRFYVLPSETNRYVTIFLAPGVRKTSQPPAHDNIIERYFDMHVREMSIEEALAEVGKTIDGLDTVYALQLLRAAIVELDMQDH